MAIQDVKDYLNKKNKILPTLEVNYLKEKPPVIYGGLDKHYADLDNYKIITYGYNSQLGEVVGAARIEKVDMNLDIRSKVELMNFQSLAQFMSDRCGGYNSFYTTNFPDYQYSFQSFFYNQVGYGDNHVENIDNIAMYYDSHTYINHSIRLANAERRQGHLMGETPLTDFKNEAKTYIKIDNFGAHNNVAFTIGDFDIDPIIAGHNLVDIISLQFTKKDIFKKDGNFYIRCKLTINVATAYYTQADVDGGVNPEYKGYYKSYTTFEYNLIYKTTNFINYERLHNFVITKDYSFINATDPTSTLMATTNATNTVIISFSGVFGVVITENAVYKNFNYTTKVFDVITNQIYIDYINSKNTSQNRFNYQYNILTPWSNGFKFNKYNDFSIVYIDYATGNVLTRYFDRFIKNNMYDNTIETVVLLDAKRDFTNPDYDEANSFNELRFVYNYININGLKIINYVEGQNGIFTRRQFKYEDGTFTVIEDSIGSIMEPEIESIPLKDFTTNLRINYSMTQINPSFDSAVIGKTKNKDYVTTINKDQQGAAIVSGRRVEAYVVYPNVTKDKVLIFSGRVRAKDLSPHTPVEIRAFGHMSFLDFPIETFTLPTMTLKNAITDILSRRPNFDMSKFVIDNVLDTYEVAGATYEADNIINIINKVIDSFPQCNFFYSPDGFYKLKGQKESTQIFDFKEDKITVAKLREEANNINYIKITSTLDDKIKTNIVDQLQVDAFGVEMIEIKLATTDLSEMRRVGNRLLDFYRYNGFYRLTFSVANIYLPVCEILDVITLENTDLNIKSNSNKWLITDLGTSGDENSRQTDFTVESYVGGFI